MRAYSNIGTNLSTTKPWRADGVNRDSIEPFPVPLLWSQFKDANAKKITLTSGASANDVSIAVSALTFEVPANTTLYFGASKKLALVTATAVPGATSITVQALPTALSSGDIAYYNPFGVVIIESGVLIGRTYAERDAGTYFGPAEVTDDEIYLLGEPLVNPNLNPIGVAYKHGSTVFENLLPDWATLNAPADEVVTVALAGTLSGGNFKVTATLASGAVKSSEDIAYNANLAAIQAGYDTIFGASQVVVAGTVASHTVTFSGASYDDLDQPMISVDANEVTGITTVTVTQTTQGGYPLLNKLRSLYNCRLGRDS